MKMLLIVVDRQCRDRLEVLLKELGVTGFTEVPEVLGMGKSGMRLGSGAFPKTSALVFTVVPEEIVSKIRAGLCQFCDDTEDLHYKMFQLDVEDVS
ncbi:MAG: hypothetical protein DRJ61_13545 [Acidobacteria bacterium]|jgi:nitrogen regulatory protein PII|nr:MAG: hypothetical protein DRJ61_13545 [Acidobacteriota bacterium]